MSQPTLKLRLILDVEYVRQGTSPEELIQNLQTIVTHSVDNGMMTGDSSAYVQTWDAGVTEVEDFDSPATYMTCIELGDLITAAEEGRLNAEGDMNAMVEDAEEAYDAHDAAITAGYRHLKALHEQTPAEGGVDFEQWDSDDYDVEGMEFDHNHGNFNPEDAERYRHTSRLLESFHNGLFTQAKDICARHGMNYALERYKFDGYE